MHDTTQASSAGSLLGSVLGGRYKLLAPLGAGGMGLVFAAKDERLQRDVAVKVIKPGSGFDDTLGKRFVREARAAAKLRDPRIVTVFDAGWEEGISFLVMERLEGQSLGARLGKGPMPPAEVARLIVGLLDGLATAHAHGIVHRDVKPANIFLSARDGLKILDFGVAAVQQVQDPAQITATGEPVGTPLYMAPEQLSGGEPDPRMDLYAVGAVLYECLTGTPIYEARHIAELYTKKLTDEPRPIRELQPQTVVPDDEPLWQRLAAIATRALERDPSRRHASAIEMKAEIVDASRSSSTELASTVAAAAPLERSDRARPKRRVALKAGVAVLVLLSVAGAIWIAAARSGSRTEPVVGLKMLSKFHDARGSSRFLDLRSVEEWQQAAEDFKRALASHDDPPVRWLAGLQFTLGQIRFCQREYEPALESFRKAAELDPGWATPQLAIAEALIRTERHADGIAAAQSAERLEPTWWVPAATIAYAYVNLAKGDPQLLARANRQYQIALSRTPDEPLVLDGFALTLRRQRLNDEAEKIARKALALDSGVTFSRCVLAEIAREKGNAAEALAMAEQAVAFLPDSVWAQVIRVEALVDLKRQAEAETLFQRALVPLMARKDHPLIPRIKELGIKLGHNPATP